MGTRPIGCTQACAWPKRCWGDVVVATQGLTGRLYVVGDASGLVFLDLDKEMKTRWNNLLVLSPAENWASFPYTARVTAHLNWVSFILIGPNIVVPLHDRSESMSCVLKGPHSLVKKPSSPSWWVQEPGCCTVATTTTCRSLLLRVSCFPQELRSFSANEGKLDYNGEPYKLALQR
jgi:hypothetical protein